MKCLITGGGGFLGSAIAKRLVERGFTVTCLQRSACPELEDLGIHCVQASITDFSALLNAFKEQDVIFHVAAKAGIWGSYDSYYQANVIGTENVIAACKRLGIQKLIYTSSPSVVFDGSDENGIDESEPYPDKHLSYYSQTNAIAEQRILKANDAYCATVSLRPHLIWGPGDNHLLPRLINKAQNGRLPLLGDQLVDSTFIENAVHAHLKAFASLSINASCSGKAYFISNGEPIPMPQLINKLLACAGVTAVEKRISPKFAYMAGFICECIYRLCALNSEPPITRFVARQLSTAHWFNLQAAEHDIGYTPLISFDDGLEL
ncbi:MAG: NAD-dependent epimerase/dehydratase family protein, partial [Planctomycetes bacterium]|nr:NAD-dependent epimerase/dehydratase family protein [Planctomycetota bacterium]